ncbi:hypothetical protein [Gaiella sp.]|jgi:hypothetical protein|uniref:hypothetical protein n=1 Tax=Gaiella sp. TaxID=2663207 RepID=UPI002E31D500|nr:hypothetical protein [Gaiella sp.]HEX5582182.1 hypothetical protein [Gaiella sp.]
MSAFIITRIHVGDYERWRRLYDQDVPRAREKATAQRIFRMVDDPNHVFVQLEFATTEDAEEARRRLVESRVLDRFDDVHGPSVLVDADA